MSEEGSSSSAEGESNIFDSYERTFQLLQKEMQAGDSENEYYKRLLSESDEDQTFSPSASRRKNGSIQKDVAPSLPSSSQNITELQLESNTQPTVVQMNEETIRLKREELDALILEIVKKEERNSAGVSDLRIKEKLIEIGQPLLVTWALEKIPGPVGMYGYTSLLQKTTEMHLGIRRLLEDRKLLQKTKRTYISAGSPRPVHTDTTAKKRSPLQQVNSQFDLGDESFFFNAKLPSQPISLFDHTEIPTTTHSNDSSYTDDTNEDFNEYDVDGCRRSKRRKKGSKEVEEDELYESKPKKKAAIPPQSYSTPPMNWPLSVEYISKVVKNGSLSKDVRRQMNSSAANFARHFVTVMPIHQLMHPSYGHYGLFALQDLDGSKILGEFTGKIKMAELNERFRQPLNVPLFRGHNFSVDIDATIQGNEFRFLNDYRNSDQTTPNVRLDCVPVGGDWHVVVVTLRPIKQGEEILADYGRNNNNGILDFTPLQHAAFNNNIKMEVTTNVVNLV